MEQVPQVYLDELAKAHGNMSATMRVLNAVEDGYYIPIEPLLNSVRSLSTDLSKHAPNAYIFGSGLINPLGEIKHEEYVNLLKENGNKYVSIGDTQAGRLLDDPSGIFKERLEDAIKGSGSTLKPNDILYGYTKEDGTKTLGLWDDISRGYAENAKGNIITVTPHAPHQRIFVQTELPALLNNPDVETINGLAKSIFVDEFDALRASGLPADKAYTKLNDTLVRGSSIEYMKRFAAPHFASDLGTVAGHDHTKAANPDMADLFKTAKPETSLIRGLFNAAAPALKVGGKFLSVLPVVGTGIGLGVNSAEAAILHGKLEEAITQRPELEAALFEYDVLLSSHAAQGGEPTVFLGEIGVQAAFNGWADRHNIHGELRSALQPSSLALMIKSGAERVADASLDVATYTAQSVIEAAQTEADIVTAQLDNIIDYATGAAAEQQSIYNALPTLEHTPDALGASSIDDNPINIYPAAAALAEIKTQIVQTEGKIARIDTGLEEPFNRMTKGESVDFLRERVGRLNDRFEENYESARDDGTLTEVMDYITMHGAQHNNAQTMQESTFTATANTNDTIQYQGMKL